MDGTDELFASLGGSLMKDLLADLQIDGDESAGLGWSLDQLERELAHLDDPIDVSTGDTALFVPPPPPPSSSSSFKGPYGSFGDAGSAANVPKAPPGLSAASLVVSRAKDRIPDYSNHQSLNRTPSAAEDAWSQSLEKFTAMALEQDFLAADSAKRSTTGTTSTTTSSSVPAAAFLSPTTFLAEAQDYDITENATIRPPPGMGGIGVAALSLPPPSGSSQTKPPPGLPPPPPRDVAKKPPGKSQANSVQDVLDIIVDGVASAPISSELTVQHPPPQTSTSQGSLAHLKTENLPELVTSTKLPTIRTPHDSIVTSAKDHTLAPNDKLRTNQAGFLLSNDIVIPPHLQQPPPPPATSTSLAFQPPKQSGLLLPPPVVASPTAPGGPLRGIIAQPILPPRTGLPLPSSPPILPPRTPGETAWQTPAAPLPQPEVQMRPQAPARIFCQVFPGAPPIPAASLESSIMKSRDLAYIIHAIMKPVLLAGESLTDYHLRFWERQTGHMGPKAILPPRHVAPEKLEKEATSRQSKTMEWMREKKALGHVAKTNVSRPRALIATPVVVTDEDALEQKQRASLWKARLFIDQGYRAMTALVETWQSAPARTVPPEVQTHLLLLLKCLGMSTTAAPEDADPVYEIDPQKALSSILKLSKGRTFVSRLLEQALLPPKAVHVLLPAGLDLMLHPGGSGSSTTTTTANEATDNRLFAAFARVITTLPALDATTVLAAAEAVQTKESLASQARMECVHALLRRGAHMSSRDPTTFGPRWKEAEDKFLQLLS